jgi:hypothetical protein
VSALPPPPPLPGDLQRRLDTLLAKPPLHRSPELSQAITRLVLDAWCRQSAPGPAFLTGPGVAQEPPDWTRAPAWPGAGREERG